MVDLQTRCKENEAGVDSARRLATGERAARGRSRAEGTGNSASAAAGIDGSPILSDSGKIYMYWMAHYRILVIKLFPPGRRGGSEYISGPCQTSTRIIVVRTTSGVALIMPRAALAREPARIRNRREIRSELSW